MTRRVGLSPHIVSLIVILGFTHPATAFGAQVAHPDGPLVHEGAVEGPTLLMSARLLARALILNNAAWTDLRRGKLVEAKVKLEQALEAAERLYPPDDPSGEHPFRARILNNLAEAERSLGEYDEALSHHLQALKIRRRFFTPDRFEQGHRHLVESLSNVSGLYLTLGKLDSALDYAEEALAMDRRLYPADIYPDGHTELAISLNNLGEVHGRRGELSRATPRLRESLEMRRRLLEKVDPRGHPLIATSLNNLGMLLLHQGRYGEAFAYLRDALAMRERLYPDGHPDLAQSQGNMASLFHEQGEFASAIGYRRRALDLYERLYPRERYPVGHSDLAQGLMSLGSEYSSFGRFDWAVGYQERALAMIARLSEGQRERDETLLALALNELGFSYLASGSYDRALSRHRKALAIRERLYPRGRYPDGHPHLAQSLTNIGEVLAARGELDEAAGFLLKSLEMNERLYPKNLYPQGHRLLAQALNNLGLHELTRGRDEKALDLLRRSVSMYQSVSEVFFAAASEAEALNFAVSLPRTRDGLIEAHRRLGRPAGELYADLWNDKALLTRVFQRRREDLLRFGDPKVLKELQEARSDLARLALAPADPTGKVAEQLRILSGRKEHLERRLAEPLTSHHRLGGPAAPGPDALARALPRDVVFIDLLRHVAIVEHPGTPARPGGAPVDHYVAFAMRSGEDVAQVDLGPARPIDEAIATWRAAIVKPLAPNDPRERLRQRDLTRELAESVGRCVWEKLRRLVPADTRLVWIAPDGALSKLPWAALPGRQPGGVLLEDHAIASVPNGPFLLAHLTAIREPQAEPGTLLAVGDVDYGPFTAPARWRPLPATRDELNCVIDSAKGRCRTVIRLDGTLASTVAVRDGLCRARYAHLAIHAFSAFADSRSRSLVAEPLFAPGGLLDLHRATPGRRNPLAFSGIVLAGANRPVLRGRDSLPTGDRGILAGEVIASLPLQDLDLVVLSVCEAGLGEVVAGEGVFGLQRAFHIAGARNVVASLWGVEDQPTAELMRLFCVNFWMHRKPPWEALRDAQLYVYRHPAQVGRLAESRGVVLSGKLKIDDPSGSGATSAARADTKLWAGFMLSGTGSLP